MREPAFLHVCAHTSFVPPYIVHLRVCAFHFKCSLLKPFLCVIYSVDVGFQWADQAGEKQSAVKLNCSKLNAIQKKAFPSSFSYL